MLDGMNEQQSAEREVRDRLPSLMYERTRLRKVGIEPSRVLLPARLNVPYDGDDATDFEGSCMGLPITWSDREEWGLIVTIFPGAANHMGHAARSRPVSGMTLTEFLLARIAEDEADARAAGTPLWEARPYVDLDYYAERHEFMVNGVDWPESTEEMPMFRESIAAHIARHDPARVLAECEAKRRIVEIHEHEDAGFNQGQGSMACYECHFDREHGPIPRGWCRTLRALALPYADHPDFDPEWRP